MKPEFETQVFAILEQMEQDETPSVDFDLKANQTCKIHFIPDAFDPDTITCRLED